MKQIWTIGRRLWMLTGFFILLMIFQGAMLFMELASIFNQSGKIAKVNLPAVRYVTLVDMMHDGVNSTVYKAFYFADMKDSKALEGVGAELKEFGIHLNEYLKILDDLPLPQDLDQPISEARILVENYVGRADKIVKLCQTGQVGEARRSLEEFNKVFEELAGKLDKLGGSVEKQTETDSQQMETQGRFYNWISVIGLVTGSLLGLFLAFWFNSDIMRTLKTSVSNLVAQTEKLGESSSKITGFASELAQASSEQAAATQETASSLEEISSMAKTTASNSQHLGQAATSANRSVQEGQRAVGQMLTAMTDIKMANDQITKQFEESNTQIEEIVKVIGEIGEKTKVINDIVFQTKLLSFNASVEAARAGEHGKGFAVVAEEVGNLARMSGESASEISAMLQSGIERAHKIVNQSRNKMENIMEEGTRKISQGTMLAESCGQFFQQIVESSKQVVQMTGDIDAATSEQSHGINEISKAVNLFDQTTKTNSVTAQNVNAAAGDLRQNYDVIGEVVHHLEKLAGQNTLKQTQRSATVSQLPVSRTNVKAPSGPVAYKMAVGHESVPNRSQGEFEDL